MKFENMTVSKLSELYMADRERELRANTIEGYRSSIDLYVIPKWGSMRVGQINRIELVEWVNSFDQEGAAHKAYKCLRQIVRWGICQLGMDVKDPTAGGYPRRHQKRKPPKILTASEVAERIEGFKGHRYEPIVLLSHSLGPRPGESYGMEWRKIDWNTGSVRVDISLQHVSGVTYEYPTKTAKSTRTVYLPKKVKKRLKKIWKKRGKPSGRIIGDAVPQMVGQEISAFARDNGLPRCTMYEMRHTWASLMVEANVPIAKVSMMMGHSDVSITYQRYVIPTDSEMMDMADEWERLMP